MGSHGLSLGQALCGNRARAVRTISPRPRPIPGQHLDAIEALLLHEANQAAQVNIARDLDERGGGGVSPMARGFLARDDFFFERKSQPGAVGIFQLGILLRSETTEVLPCRTQT